MKFACKILMENLPSQVQFKDPHGGYFIWLVFPVGFNVASFNDRLRKDYKVCGIPGGRFSITNQATNCLRLCVVFHQIDVVEKGISQLCLAINDHFQRDSV